MAFLIILLVIILCSISLPSFSINDYTWTVVNPAIEVSSADSETSMQDGNFLNLDSASAILIEQNSGQILYEHNIHPYVLCLLSCILLPLLQQQM